MANPLNRRRFLTLSAAAASVGAFPAQAAQISRWRGTALGASASMILTGMPEAKAQAVFRAVEDEVARLEQVFSLYRETSEISRLNRDGRLSMPSPDLLDVLSLSARLHSATNGAFDPTVQPMWLALANGQDMAAAQAKTGWHHLRFDTGAVHLTRPGMAITLNGIAQGYVTDRVSALLRQRGLTNILIDIGEVAALGGRPDGTDWQAGIARPDGQIVHQIALRDRALATSAPLGTVLNDTGMIGHILDPRAGALSAKRSLVSVSADTAALADGLSTALCLMNQDQATAAIDGLPGTRLELFT